jgi:hypothetical protein
MTVSLKFFKARSGFEHGSRVVIYPFGQMAYAKAIHRVRQGLK